MITLKLELISLAFLGLLVLASSATPALRFDVVPSDQPSGQNDPTPKVPLSIPLSNYYNLQYSGKVQIGSNNQPFDLLFDTGFPWIWVSAANDVGSSNPQNYFGCSSSSTCKYSQDHNSTMKDSFTYIAHSQTVKGLLISDNVALTSNNRINQMFLVSSTTDMSVESKYTDGVCGLSPKNDRGQPTLLDNLHANGQIDNKTFGLYLSDNSESYGDVSAEITFGGTNSKYYTGNFTTVSTLNSYYWQIDLRGGIFMAYGNQKTEVDINAVTAVLASGINNILMSSQDFRSFTTTLKTTFNQDCSFDFGGPSQNFICPCPNGNTSQYPNISFVLNKQVLSIPPSLYFDIKENGCYLLVQGTLDDSDNYLATKETDDNGDQPGEEEQEENSSKPPQDSPSVGTYLEDQSLNNLNTSASTKILLSKGSYIVLGGVFLRNFYTVFDAENQRVSFARAINIPPSVITTLEVIYLIFGIFILVMFLVFVACFIRIWTTKKVPVTDKSALERSLLERRVTSSQFTQTLESS